MEKDDDLKRRLLCKMEFLRRNSKFQELKKAYAESNFTEWELPKEWKGFIDGDLLAQLYEYDCNFPKQPISFDQDFNDLLLYPFPSIKLIHIFQKEECAKIEYNKIYMEEKRIPSLNKSRKQEFLFKDVEETNSNGVLVKIGKHTGWKESLLSIDFVNKEDSTIMLKINLNRNKTDIHQDIDILLKLLGEEANLYGIDFKRTKKRPTKGAKSIYDKYDLLIEVWDKVKKGGKSIYDIAEEKFPEVFKYHEKEIAKAWQLISDRQEGKNINQLPWDGDEDEPMPIDPESAIKKINRYYDEADRMINKEGWKEI